MIKVENITNEPIQRHTILTEAQDVILRLYFISTVQAWFIDVEYGDIRANGVRLSVGVSHIQSSNMPLDFRVTDNQNIGLDPLTIDDFENGRCTLYMLEAADMEAFRGQPVPL